MQGQAVVLVPHLSTTPWRRIRMAMSSWTSLRLQWYLLSSYFTSPQWLFDLFLVLGFSFMQIRRNVGHLSGENLSSIAVVASPTRVPQGAAMQKPQQGFMEVPNTQQQQTPRRLEWHTEAPPATAAASICSGPGGCPRPPVHCVLARIQGRDYARGLCQ